MTTINTDKDKGVIVVCNSNSVLNVEKDTQYLIANSNDTIVLQTESTKTLAIGTQGPQGIPGQIGQTQFNRIVSAGQTETVDGLSLSLVDAVMWKLCLSDRVTNKRRFITVDATHEDNSIANYTVGPITGSSLTDLPYSLDVQILSGFLSLRVSNTGVNDLVASVIRVKIDAFNL